MSDPIEILPFALELLKRQSCPYCHAQLQAKDVSAQGNRRGTDGKSYYFYEVMCSKCDHPSMTLVTSRHVNTEGLYSLLSEHYSKSGNDGYSATGEGSESSYEPPSEPKDENPEEEKPQGIPDSEITKAKEMLEKCESFDEVLKMLGITDSDKKKFYREGDEIDDKRKHEGK